MTEQGLVMIGLLLLLETTTGVSDTRRWGTRPRRQNRSILSADPLILSRRGGESLLEETNNENSIEVTHDDGYWIVSSVDRDSNIRCRLVWKTDTLEDAEIWKESVLNLQQYEDNDSVDVALWETLFRLSHVVEISQPRFSSHFAHIVQRALQNRRQIVEPQEPIILVLHADSEEHRIQLALDWDGIAPDLVGDFWILIPDKFPPSVLPGDMLTISSKPPLTFIDRSSFPVLLQKVYQALGGQSEHGLVVSMAEDSMLSSNDNSALITSAAVASSRKEVATRDISPHPLNHVETCKMEKKDVNQPDFPESAIVTTSKDGFGDDDQQGQLMERIDLQLDEFQSNTEANWMDASRLPMDFGHKVTPIVNELHSLESSSPFYKSTVQRLIDLHGQHLQVLRDHYGYMYETMLDRNPTNNHQWQRMQAKLMEQFAFAAMVDLPVDVSQDIASTMKGLKDDFAALTDQRLDDSLVGNDDDDDEQTPVSLKRAKLKKWAKKLGSRLLMLGINYLQGWLAYQGIKRNALERERDLPKFPLF